MGRFGVEVQGQKDSVVIAFVPYSHYITGCGVTQGICCVCVDSGLGETCMRAVFVEAFEDFRTRLLLGVSCAACSG